MTSYLSCYLWGGKLEAEDVTEDFYASFSQLWVYCHWCHGKRSFLVLYSQWEHGSWAFTWFLQQTVDVNTALCHNMGHRRHHSPLQQHKPWVSAWPLDSHLFLISQLKVESTKRRFIQCSHIGKRDREIQWTEVLLKNSEVRIESK